MTKTNDKVIIQDFRGRCIWPHEVYNIEDIENPISKKFADFDLKCPLNPEEYLDNNYGKGWQNIGKTQDYDHISRENQSVLSFDMITFEPAKPFL